MCHQILFEKKYGKASNYSKYLDNILIIISLMKIEIEESWAKKDEKK